MQRLIHLILSFFTLFVAAGAQAQTYPALPRQLDPGQMSIPELRVFIDTALRNQDYPDAFQVHANLRGAKLLPEALGREHRAKLALLSIAAAEAVMQAAKEATDKGCLVDADHQLWYIHFLLQPFGDPESHITGYATLRHSVRKALSEKWAKDRRPGIRQTETIDPECFLG